MPQGSQADLASANQGGQTLYDRLGGDAFINLLVCSFFDEIVENPDLQPFFVNISVSALKTHQVKLFRVIFGNENEKPEEEDLLDFMLRTHTRLFRELGLGPTHFDMVASCFVQGLQTFGVDKEIVDECVAILVPLRIVFEYGEKVAQREKIMDEHIKKALPLASPKTMETDAEVVLPEYSKIKIPDWLPETLEKKSTTGVVRAWTCDLTDRFGDEGDAQIADTFLDQPYMDHHVYLVAFLQLAFFPDEGVDAKHRRRIMEIVMYPRGRGNAKLSRELFDRMITQFLITSHKMGLSRHATDKAENKLRSYRSYFAKKTTIVGGVDAPHILRNIRRDTDDVSTGGLSETGSVLSLSNFFSGDDSDSDDDASETESYRSGSTNLSGRSGRSSRSSKKQKQKKKKKKSRFSDTKIEKGKKRSSSGAMAWLRGTIWASTASDAKIPTAITA
ncbi:truncated hemoglobin GlbN [Seminavis robusta]|uniref:Truncated hemoglobin GlbN n=1 Tax=Seminavis robusta TaxID=568900 RepID=A0A9N8DYR2_9STRA|nr:truncated hemoglobin GlbN [Seminavis robusta]|eukprot:Sro453_g146090.1 truncated hemoglobin GlbN (447) ;mRNA; f:24495-25835